MADSIPRNRAHWEADAIRWADAGRRSWAQDEPTWGIWSVPESQVQLLGETAGADVVELGCDVAVPDHEGDQLALEVRAIVEDRLSQAGLDVWAPRVIRDGSCY